MALPDYLRPSTATWRNSGISGVSLANNANFLGSAIISNSTNLDSLADISLSYQYNTNPTIGQPIRIYILYSLDGTNYEDGAGIGTGSFDIDPFPHALVNAVGVSPDISGHLSVIRGIDLEPFNFKILLMNDATGQTASGVTVNIWTYNMSLVD